jgi:hypothetical protein
MALATPIAAAQMPTGYVMFENCIGSPMLKVVPADGGNRVN